MSSPSTESTSSQSNQNLDRAPWVGVCQISGRWNVIQVTSEKKVLLVNVFDKPNEAQIVGQKLAEELAIPFFENMRWVRPMITLAKWTGQWVLLKTIEEKSQILSSHDTREEALEAGKSLPTDDDSIFNAEMESEIPSIVTLVNLFSLYNVPKENRGNVWLPYLLSSEKATMVGTGRPHDRYGAYVEACNYSQVSKIPLDPSIDLSFPERNITVIDLKKVGFEKKENR
jgi:hypothetical protein